MQYTSGTLTALALTPSAPYLLSPPAPTLTFTGAGPNAERQEGPHPHEAYVHPADDEVLVPDLGADKVRRLRRQGEGGEGRWEVVGEVLYPPGSGPRHVVFHGAPSLSLSPF